MAGLEAATGRFFALGVGPGDPELVTLRAIAILQQADAIYHAGPAADRGRALDVVRRWLRPEQRLSAVRNEVMPEIRGYRAAALRIAADCRAGLVVAFITEGDPTLYSTASYIWEEVTAIAPGIPIEVVPGVSSITAAAARLRWPLARKGETIAIVPAHYHGEDLAGWIERASTTILLKPGGTLSRLPVLPDHEAVYLENLATDREWVSHDLAGVADRHEYFSLVLVKRRANVSPVAHAPGSPGVCVVGIGPGAADLLTLRARRLLESADAIVGYEGYLRLLEPLELDAEAFGSPIGAEADRARQALELAQAGRRVALVSSGDAGVYGMASLLLELAPEGVAIEIVPGVTAATAAAALLGAPLGHDFACISLSDLLTPWEVIEKRLEAAGSCDFVVALYNPASQKRTWQLDRARDILLGRLKPATPVGIVDRAFRDGQSVRLTSLGELTSDSIGMETIVIVGSSQTRVVQGKMITPRGYSAASRERERREDLPSRKRKRRGEVSATETSAGRSRLTRGDAIMRQSFDIIERELGPHELLPWLFAVVRRMIHATADFDFAQSVRHSPGFDQSIRAALGAGTPIVTDVEMVRIGVSKVAVSASLAVHCFLNEPEVDAIAELAGLTRTAAGIRLAARRHRQPILVIGNAPTAIDEALRLVEADNWQPAAILGLPVGFVGVVEAKARLQNQSRVPYLSCEGRKGGSAVAAAAMNALIEWVRR